MTRMIPYTVSFSVLSFTIWAASQGRLHTDRGTKRKINKEKKRLHLCQNVTHTGVKTDRLNDVFTI